MSTSVVDFEFYASIWLPFNSDGFIISTLPPPPLPSMVSLAGVHRLPAPTALPRASVIKRKFPKRRIPSQRSQAIDSGRIILSGRPKTKIPQPNIPNQSSQAEDQKVIEQNLAKPNSPHRRPKRQMPNKGSKAKVLKRRLPNLSSQPNTSEHQFPNEGHSTEVAKLSHSNPFDLPL